MKNKEKHWCKEGESGSAIRDVLTIYVTCMSDGGTPERLSAGFVDVSNRDGEMMYEEVTKCPLCNYKLEWVKQKEAIIDVIRKGGKSLSDGSAGAKLILNSLPYAVKEAAKKDSSVAACFLTVILNNPHDSPLHKIVTQIANELGW